MRRGATAVVCNRRRRRRQRCRRHPIDSSHAAFGLAYRAFTMRPDDRHTYG